MSRIKTRGGRRELRHLRVRKRVHGTAERPRLAVFRSSKHIYAQVIDDDRGVTLCQASTLDPELRTEVEAPGTVEGARQVGEMVGRRAKALGIGRVVFDRGGYLYHGRVAAVANGARAAGLEF